MILRIYALFFVFNGINSIIRSFFTYSLRSKLATLLAILKDFVLIVPIGFLCQDMLYLSLHPDEAAALSEKVIEYFDRKGAPKEYLYFSG